MSNISSILMFDHAEEWYAVSTAPHLLAAPSIEGLGGVVLVLRQAGWSEVWIDELIGGEGLGSLVEACRNRWFITNFRHVQCGGWLPLTEIERLFDRLQRIESAFSSQEQSVIDWYLENRGLAAEDSTALMRRQYQQAALMLRTAIQRGRPLRLIADE